LALSATIGNYKSLCDWLTELEKSRGRKLHSIEYSLRYNNLIPYVFTHGENEGQLHELNTLFAIDKDYITTYKKFPSDFKLLPQHLMQIHEGLKGKKSVIISFNHLRK
jgi:hypothetical protein